MEYLQYNLEWKCGNYLKTYVLNLIITGMSSIQPMIITTNLSAEESFKPYYPRLLKCSSWLHK